MTESGLLVLRQLFLTSYQELKVKLTRRLGSADLADDAVQDTWLRLNRAEHVGPVSSPVNYLYRIALNVARDRILSERRYLDSAEIEKMLDLADEAADPASIVEARSELRLVETFISELPSRQRDILVAARLDGLSRSEIAKRLGISLSLVEKELKSAHEYCLARRKQMRK
ncbi:RNA polymerase sigma factor [Bradyrhizobium sp. Ai1a-2]|uniref:RNA polymerase sigma factor n=1 Tax=Bradyrhizobium sp. Ai1a-2 TaxID=196490 RepID=UPI00040F0EFB|nr:RNA polymerase sigma factor [Bradyrhizobium sp. Ai1a-2]